MSDFAVEDSAIEAPASVGDALEAAEATGAETTPVAPVATEPAAEPQEPAFDQRELMAELEWSRQQIAEMNARLTAQPQPAEPAAQQQFDPEQLVDEFGQVRPEQLIAFLDARNTAMLEQVQGLIQNVSAPLEQQAREAIAARYGEMVDSTFAENVSRFGDISPIPETAEKARAIAESRAAQMLPELNQRFGTNPDGTTRETVLAMAIERAAGEVRELFGQVGTAATRQHNAHLATLAGANGEVGQGATGAADGPPAFSTTREIVDHFAARARTLPT